MDLQLGLAKLITPAFRDEGIAALAPVIGAEAAGKLSQALGAPQYSARHNGISTQRCKALIDDFVAEHQFSPSSITRLLDYVRTYARLSAGRINAQSLAGSDVLDYGCGTINPFALGIVLYLNGARTVIGVDIGETNQELSRASIRQLAVEVLADPARFDLLGVGADQVAERFRALDWPRLFRSESVYQVQVRRGVIADLEGSVDFVLSTSVLEHVTDLAGELKRLHAITTPDATMVHRIDFTDHRHNLPDYHKFMFMRDGNHAGLNGLRYVDMRRLLGDAGFAVVHEEMRRDPIDDAFMAGLAPAFQHYSKADLMVGYVGVSVRRVGR